MHSTPSPDPQRVKEIALRASELAKSLDLEPSRAIGAALTEAGIMNIHERQGYFGPIARAKEFKPKKGPTRPHGMDAVEAEAREEDLERRFPKRRTA